LSTPIIPAFGVGVVGVCYHGRHRGEGRGGGRKKRKNKKKSCFFFYFSVILRHKGTGERKKQGGGPRGDRGGEPTAFASFRFRAILRLSKPLLFY